MKILRSIWRVILETFKHFAQSHPAEKGAALAYFTVFSLIPMMVIVIYLFGVVLGREYVSADLLEVMEQIFGRAWALEIEKFLEVRNRKFPNLWLSMVGISVILISSTAMFNQIYRAFNGIWQIRPKKKKAAIGFVYKRVSSLILLILIGFIMLLSTSVHTLLLAFAQYLPEGLQYVGLIEQVLSFLLMSILFSIMYMLLGDALVPFLSAVLAGMFTALLFLFIKIIIGYYLNIANINTYFGAASTIAILMVWIFFTSQIIFLGASFAYVVSEQLGWPIKPNKNAVAYVHKEIPGT